MRNTKGFTLIELMIAMAIVGILAAIAIPSYREQVRKSRRADAQVALTAFASAMERRFTINNSYCNLGDSGGDDTCGDGGASGDTGAPNFFPQTAPLDGTTPYYNLTINDATASSYTLSAMPIAGTDQVADKCYELRLNNIGQKTAFDTSSNEITGSTCWD